MRPITLGELLYEGFLVPIGITKYRVAKEIVVAAQRIGGIVRAQRIGGIVPTQRIGGIVAAQRIGGIVAVNV